MRAIKMEIVFFRLKTKRRACYYFASLQLCKNRGMKNYSIAIHGGAGNLIKGKMTPERETACKNALQKAIDIGYALLKNGDSAIDAAEQAVISLENTPLFNAGKGSVFTNTGTHEMDACIMEGEKLNAGAVSLITGIKNPISLAKKVMLKSEHVFLAGEGAMRFAKEIGYGLEKADYFYDAYRYEQWQKIKNSDAFKLDHNDEKDSKFGTVGAVACDQNGNLAAATSTGGMTNKKWGRVGDSPMIGAGTYANNKTCAVSCTGSGEFFMRGVVAYDVSCLMEYKGYSLEQAAAEVILNRIKKLGGSGGLIAVDAKGRVTTPFNTKGMYRAIKSFNGDELVAIYK